MLILKLSRGILQFYEMQQHRHASQMLQNLRIKREDMEDTLMSSNIEDADIG